MSDTPDRKRTDLHDGNTGDERNPPTPTEFIDAILYWLRHWWDAPREKSKAADWALAGLTVVITAAAFWTAFIFEDQLALMRDADRPWIKVSATVTSPLTYDRDGMHIGFTFILKNVGKSPAENVSIAPHLVTAFMGDDLSQTQKRICEHRASAKDEWLRYMLFPDDPFSQQIQMQMSAADVDSHWNKFELGQGPIDLIPVALVGCVDYTYESSPRHHQTGFAVDIVTVEGGIPLKSKTPLPPFALTLREHAAGGHFAD